MKIRYNRHSILTLVDNSIKEQLDAILDESDDIKTIATISGKLFWCYPPAIHNEPVIDGYEFSGWVSLDETMTPKIKFYTKAR